MNDLIATNSAKLQEICKKNFVAELYVFGSVLTEEFSDKSDLDFAYVLKEDLNPIEHGEAFFSLLEDLQNLFKRRIDLISYRIIKNPIFKQELDRTKKSIYAAA